MNFSNKMENFIACWGRRKNLTHADRGEGGGVHKNLTFADGGEGGPKWPKNADVINERPLMKIFSLYKHSSTDLITGLAPKPPQTPPHLTKVKSPSFTFFLLFKVFPCRE